MVDRVEREFLMRLGRGLVPIRYWSSNTRNGEEWNWRLVWKPFGFRLGLFEHLHRQSWSPKMTEWQRTRGIIIGSTQIGYSKRGREYHDGKEPRCVRID